MLHFCAERRVELLLHARGYPAPSIVRLISEDDRQVALFTSNRRAYTAFIYPREEYLEAQSAPDPSPLLSIFDGFRI